MATDWKPRRSPEYGMAEGPQSLSPAVMAQPTKFLDRLDDFPTRKWATRALIEEVFGEDSFSTRSRWEPTCGRGYQVNAGAVMITSSPRSKTSLPPSE